MTTSRGPLTAAAVIPDNGTLITGTVDATGCNIGVYVRMGASGDVQNATIIGHPNYFGVFVDGGHADVKDSVINDVGEPQPNGSQHGVAVAYYSTLGQATGEVAGNQIHRYQKGGVVVSGSNATVVTDNNTIQGLGRVNYIAQNGVQYSVNATGAIYSNWITDNYYTGCSNQDAAKTGCVPYVSTGLLLYDINPPDVSKFHNFYRNNQRNLYVAPSASIH